MYLIPLFCCTLYLSLCPVIDSSSPCPDGFSFHKKSRKCFKVEKWLEDRSLSQMDARLTCAKENAFLASIGSDDENDFIKNLLVAKDVVNAYIGLQSLPHNVSQRYFCDGTKLNYTNWIPGKPDNGDFKDDGCVLINVREGKWDDWTCNANMETGPWAAVCQIRYLEEKNVDQEKRNCPEGFEYCPSTRNCYKVITKEKAMSQMVAEFECEYHKAHLVSINSDEENQFVSDLAMKHPLSAMRVFIGLISDKTNTDASKRYWVDGTPIDYRKWEHMKPGNEPYLSSNCVVMIPERNGVWNDWACDKACCAKHAVYGTVCEIDHD